MKRSEFLKTIGLAGVGSMLHGGRANAAPDTQGGSSVPHGVDCVLIPQETEGPYPLDLSGDPSKFRQDVTEGRPGTPLDVVFTVVDINDNCNPIANARVDIWHTDKEGVYSGFSQPGANTVGETFMRGIQMTNVNGEVRFHTIYPGWYPGRITHIHFQVFIGSMLRATSQCAFPDEVNVAVYSTPMYASKGQNTSVANNAADGVFRGSATDLEHQLLNIVPNATTGGYDGSLVIGINRPAAGVTVVDPETGGQFRLGQNEPNPCTDLTTIAFVLERASRVRLTIYDTNGNEVARPVDADLSAGGHTARWDRTMRGARLPAGTYVYQLTVRNSMGLFSQCKAVTVL